MLKADMTKYCTAAALAVRTFITGSSNLNNYGAGIRQIGTDLGLRLDDLDNLKKTRGSWLGTMVDFLGTARVTAVYQLIANGDKKPASWGAAPNAAQQSALNIQKQTDVYNTFKRFATLWNGGANPHPKWQQEAGATGSGTKQALEALAARAAANATGNCGETSLLAYLLLATLPRDGKYQAAYTAAHDLTVGWYDGSPFDHAYVIVSNRGYATDKNTVASYCVCDAWLGRAYPDLLSDLHYGGTNLQDVKQSSPAMPELKVGTYAYASTGDDLTKIQGVTQILHSAFLDELAKL
ncbi:hypothetical protein NX784_02520 [Massilia pinisoli]|uniref:Uncharacterized protein n=1 Tax=Massilia pinisoli TaxID=1772194 RepID=A0ABT1ZKL6_9BURK|nr:hypothetical protein [Massilia pinisoli]MCS0580454.1 hypothetical protein [Massilia pinisoli]